MTCEYCNKAHNSGMVAFYRIGTLRMGYGNIGITGCHKHIKLALERLNKAALEEPDRI